MGETGRPTLRALLIFCLALLVLLPDPAHGGRRSKKKGEAEESPADQNAQVSFEEGLLFYNNGQLKRALERFRQAVDSQPNSPEAHYMLGVTYFHLAQLDKAEKALRQSLEVNPFFTDAHNILGAVYDQQGQVDKAVAEWNIVLSDQNFPQPWNPTFNIGRAMASRESWEEAVVWFKRTIDLNGRWFRAWYHLGLAQEELGNPAEAKESYEKALEEIPPDNPFLYLLQFRMALSCYKLGYNMCSQEYFQEVCRSRPDTPEGRKACEFLEMLKNQPAADRGLPQSIYR